MKKRLLLASFTLITAAYGLSGCYNDNIEELYPAGGAGCDTVNITFAAKIAPILNGNCTSSGCHSGSAPAGGYNLTTYQGAKAAVDNNRLIGSITHASGFSPMPKNLPKLPDCDIQKITIWVNHGAPNN
ncbi:MAG: hypothetical protein EOP49_09985 [Sphingobacteriales bacterium]|nr:MAG: hypothetical protein EOP49_09985 [Sphingobacteriales bacterium]